MALCSGCRPPDSGVKRIEAERDVEPAREERLVAELEAARVQCEHLSARVADLETALNSQRECCSA